MTSPETPAPEFTALTPAAGKATSACAAPPANPSNPEIPMAKFLVTTTTTVTRLYQVEAPGLDATTAVQRVRRGLAGEPLHETDNGQTVVGVELAD